MTDVPQLFCPIRGILRSRPRARDELTFTEEKRRIDCISLLLTKGYPKDHIDFEPVLFRLGHSARGSLRADIAVYDRPVAAVRECADIMRRREFVKIICEIKRDSADAQSAKIHQLRPALELIPSTSAIGIYWDDVEQTILLKEIEDSSIRIREASIATLPEFGAAPRAQDIHFGDVRPAVDLVQRFAKLDDILHQAGYARDERYAILFKVLLVKIYDEQNAKRGNGRMIIQDFSLRNNTDEHVRQIFQCGLDKALTAYGKLLPDNTDGRIGCSGAVLREISRIICSINVLDSAPHVLQDFFMYFGRFLYKVDLGQYFTPYEVIDFIVRIVNPRFGDRVTDPACGTGDFLVAARRIALKRHGVDLSGWLHGVDTAAMAVTLSNFNMLLNGCNRPDIVSCGDSLQDLLKHEGSHTVALCNPPFGTHIVERRKSVLRHFELGTEPEGDRRVPLAAQETGLLFVEVCLRTVRPGGRVGLILPNGYLGNRSPRYVRFRHWLLRHARIAAVIGFPRFTFKRSGADVSASAVILERRAQPLPDLSQVEDFPIHFNLVEKVGWDLQSKQAKRLFRRDPRNGAVLFDANGEPIVDADFDRVLGELYASLVVPAFEWLADGVPEATGSGGWSIPASRILARADLCLDPKRWCAKHARVVAAVRSVPHLMVGEVLRPVERTLRKKQPETTYRYVAIEHMYESFGAYLAEEYPGWALPGRARLLAAPGDVFIANLWSSAGKWMIAGEEAQHGRLLVTSGCAHLEVIPGQEHRLPDLVFGLCSEAFRVQMRALATGSDGLATVALEDLLAIVVPCAPSAAAREAIEQRLRETRRGQAVLPRVVCEALAASAPAACIPPRSSHVVQV